MKLLFGSGLTGAAYEAARAGGADEENGRGDVVEELIDDDEDGEMLPWEATNALAPLASAVMD